jgi:hypothetical protein
MMKCRLIVTMGLLLIASVFNGCYSSEEKIDTVEEEVTDYNEDPDRTCITYLNEQKEYRLKAMNEILLNMHCIADFRTGLEQEKKEISDCYYIKLEELEKRNNDQKKKMDEYKADGGEKWSQFKTEFDHDMKELSKALDDLTVCAIK